MIDRQHHKLIFCCDSCDTTLESEDDFAIAWATAKREGWTTRKICNEWLHSCPDCKPPT